MPVGSKTRREGHARKIADHFALSGFDVHQGHFGIIAAKGHIGDVLRHGREARGHHQLVAFADIAQIGPVLIHDGQTLDALVLAALLVDKHDAGIEEALFTGQARIDRIGDHMGDTTPIVGVGEILLAGQLLARKSVPQPEFGFQPARRITRHPPGYQSLRIDDLPRVEFGRHIGAGIFLDERGFVDRQENAGPLEIIGDHCRDLRAEIGADEIADRNRQRLEIALVERDGDFGLRLRAQHEAGQQGQPDPAQWQGHRGQMM